MSHGADSAGRPWEGRSFQHHDTAYAGDDGSAPAGWAAAVAALIVLGQQGVVEALVRLDLPLVAGQVVAVEGRKHTQPQFSYKIEMPVGSDRLYEIKAVIGSGDDGEPVLTLMKPDED